MLPPEIIYEIVSHIKDIKGICSCLSVSKLFRDAVLDVVTTIYSAKTPPPVFLSQFKKTPQVYTRCHWIECCDYSTSKYCDKHCNCIRCGSDNLAFTRAQTRSMNESTMTFVHCIDCKLTRTNI